MSSLLADELLSDARLAAPGSDTSVVLDRIDGALATSDDGPANLGQLYLARALALQCSSELQQAAEAMDIAHALLQQTNRIGMTAYAGAAGAVMWFRAGHIERTVELAVEVLVRLDDAEPDDVHVHSARNALAQVFHQLSSHEIAIDLARHAFHASGVPGAVRAHFAFNLAQTMVEATIASTRPDPAWLDEAIGAADYLGRGDLPTTGMIDAAIRGEVFVLRGDHASFSALDTHLDMTSSADHSVYAKAGSRLVAWHQLVRATGAFRWGDPLVAVRLLDRAAPALELLGDEARLNRALEVRAEAKSAAQDPEGAADDALALARRTRLTQSRQLGRLAALIARRAELERTRDLLITQTDRLEHEASIDPVTGLHSRRWLEVRMDELSESESSVCVILLDLDRFKSINDTHGHTVGDRVLAAVGTLLRDASPRGDHARFGGEEFVLLFEDPAPNSCRKLAEDILTRIRSHDWGALGPSLALTASAGVAVGPGERIRDVVRQADLALYDAKSQGRDRSATASGLLH